MQLLFCLVNPLPVLAVDHEHEALRARVVMSPERTDFILSSNIPHVELDVFVCDGLNVESNLTDRQLTFRKLKNGHVISGEALPVGIVVTD